MECSTAWEGLSAWGTAARADFWIALEQPGPWGREALTESHLDAALGAALQEAATAAGGRVLLIRGVGAHADTHDVRRRRVYLAGGLAGTPWLLAGDVTDPAALLELPWDALAGTAVPDIDGFTPTAPVLLVCTNAKRDRCCALRGRPIATELAASGLDVWECSHTGGHRFAPTGVVLPLGQVVGRLDLDLARQVLDAAASGRFAVGTLNETHDRGVSHLTPRQQAAVSWVRAHEGETDPVALAVVGGSDATVTVQHADGRVWELAVESVVGDLLPDSCGKPAKRSVTWRVAER